MLALFFFLISKLLVFSKLNILLINLDRRPDKLKICEFQLKRLNANFTRIPAVDGKLLYKQILTSNRTSAEILNDKSLLVDNIYLFESGMNHFGCTLSHLKALKYIVDNDVDGPVLILEDDFAADGDALTKTEEFIKMFPKDWDMFYAGHCHSRIPCREYSASSHFACKIGNQEIPCAHAYVVNGARAAQKIYTAGNTAKLKLADLFAQKANVKRYIIYPYLFSQLRKVQADVQSSGGHWYKLVNSTLLQDVKKNIIKSSI